MKHSRAPLAALLVSAHLIAAVCAAAEAANIDGVVEDAAVRTYLREAARESGPAVRVTVDAERRVFFGQEQVGTCDDLGPLKERVRQAVKRSRRAARVRGDKKTAASAGTIFICASPDSRYEDVVKVIDAVKEAGGKAVGLDTGCRPPG